MKTKISLFLFLMSLFMTSAFSQKKSEKELKEELKLESQKQVEAMVYDTAFVFVGRTALPTGMKSVNLSSNPNYMKFQPEMIESEMPYFGKGYSGIGYGGDTGLKFKGKPEKFTIKKKKNNYQIDTNVKAESDNFRISLSVTFEGNASLSIISNNRSTISYQGEISPLNKPLENK
jgi:hypothetical protein